MEIDLLGDLAEGTTLLAEVNDETNATALRTTDALLDGVDQVRLTCADIGAENVGTVACQSSKSMKQSRRTKLTFVVNAQRQFFRLVGEVSRVADCDRRQYSALR